MRHRHKGKTLDRKSDARKALLRNLATSLVLYEKIKTTKAKAQALRPYVERMITTGKDKTLHARRELLKKLMVPGAVEKVLAELSPRYATSPGGDTRIIKIRNKER